MDSSLPVAAGTIATLVFAGSTLPMLGKAVRSKDLRSYSRGNLVLANLGNVVYSLYVYSSSTETATATATATARTYPGVSHAH